MDIISEKAKKIKLFLTDVDGVLTDGTLSYDEHGVAIKNFHVHDGLGLKRLMQQGIQVGVITACKAKATLVRMRDLGIEHVYTGVSDKLAAYESLLQQLNLSDDVVAYVGDDLPDLPILQRAGLGIAVANATAPVLAQAAWITERRGGQCAIREVCDRILSIQNASHL